VSPPVVEHYVSRHATAANRASIERPLLCEIRPIGTERHGGWRASLSRSPFAVDAIDGAVGDDLPDTTGSALCCAERMRWSAVFLLVLPLFGSCGDDRCTPGEYRCRDGNAENCRDDQDLRRGVWRATPCEGLTCVRDRVAHEAFCAELAQPEAGCGTGSAERSVCDGNRLLLCTAGGFLLDHEDCGACIAGDQPFCAEGAQPDPKCGGHESACDGTTLIFCHRDYRLRHYDCPDAGGCRVSSVVSVGFCALERESDPRCPSHTLEGRSAYCDGNVATNCIDGYAVWKQQCLPGAVTPTCRLEPPESAYAACPNGAGSTQGTQGGQPPYQ